jgi:hypothetical protein
MPSIVQISDGQLILASTKRSILTTESIAIVFNLHKLMKELKFLVPKRTSKHLLMKHKNSRRNTHLLMPSQIANCQLPSTGEALVVLTSPTSTEIKVHAAHATLFLSLRSLSQDSRLSMEKTFHSCHHNSL